MASWPENLVLRLKLFMNRYFALFKRLNKKIYLFHLHFFTFVMELAVLTNLR